MEDAQGGRIGRRPVQGGRLVIGPYLHLPWNVGRRLTSTSDRKADNPIEDLQVAFFDHWLKGKDNGVDKGAAASPGLRDGGGPLARRRRLADPGNPVSRPIICIRAGGSKNSAGGNGRISTHKPTADEPPDHYVYNPADPVPRPRRPFVLHARRCAGRPGQSGGYRGTRRRARLFDAGSRPRRRGHGARQSHALHASSSAVDTPTGRPSSSTSSPTRTRDQS